MTAYIIVQQQPDGSWAQEGADFASQEDAEMVLPLFVSRYGAGPRRIVRVEAQEQETI